MNQLINLNTLPENHSAINKKLFILDPITIMIKLAILSNKLIGKNLHPK